MTDTRIVYLLACGHSSNATREDGSPACVICAPKKEAYEIAEEVDLAGRWARCSCGTVVQSSLDLAFFEYRGKGSRAAAEHCRHCGYFEVAHKPDAKNSYICSTRGLKFEPHGPYDHDLFFDGCSGWD